MGEEGQRCGWTWLPPVSFWVKGQGGNLLVEVVVTQTCTQGHWSCTVNQEGIGGGEQGPPVLGLKSRAAEHLALGCSLIWSEQKF